MSSPSPSVEVAAGPEPRRHRRSFPSIFLGVFIILFPKCPLCGATWLGIIGSPWIYRAPALKWVLPFFVIFLGLHAWVLWLSFRRAQHHGYGPFAAGLVGSVLSVGGSFCFPEITWLPPAAILLLAASALGSQRGRHRTGQLQLTNLP